MLVEFTILNFKSHRCSTLPLADLSVLVGANASGKSNALEALQLLVWAATGRPLGELVYALRQQEVRIRGRPSDLTYGQVDGDVCLRAVFREPDAGSWASELAELRLDVTLRIDDQGVRVVDETLLAPRAPGGLALYGVESAADQFGAELTVRYNNFARGGKKPKIPAVDRQLVFTQLTTPARLASASHRKSGRLIPEACRYVRDSLTRTLFLDAVPRRMRQPSFPQEERLLGDGSNVSAVVWALCEQQRQGEVLDFIRSLPEQSIDGLDFVHGPRGDVLLQLLETFGGERRRVDASVLSDGTLRVLSVAAALLSVETGTLVVIEELDHGVHPSRAAELLRRIEKTAQARSLRVLVTTHNPALMDALSDQALDAVVVCYRDPEHGASRLVRLADLPDYPSLVSQGSLGELVTRRTVERYLPGMGVSRPDPAAWLDSLFAEGE